MTTTTFASYAREPLVTYCREPLATYCRERVVTYCRERVVMLCRDRLVKYSPRDDNDQLKRHSFVERHPYGLKFHDKIRELLLERLKFTSPSEYDKLTRRLMAYYAEKAGIKTPEETEQAAKPPEVEAATKYHIHIDSAQGVVIGDGAQVVQHFRGNEPTDPQPRP